MFVGVGGCVGGLACGCGCGCGCGCECGCGCNLADRCVYIIQGMVGDVVSVYADSQCRLGAHVLLPSRPQGH